MSRTRMWIIEEDQYGATDRKFCVDDPLHIPRIGEFVDSDDAGGWVTYVQYNYREQRETNGATQSDFRLIVNVMLRRKK